MIALRNNYLLEYVRKNILKDKYLKMKYSVLSIHIPPDFLYLDESS
jgi:hypothetical protein